MSEQAHLLAREVFDLLDESELAGERLLPALVLVGADHADTLPIFKRCLATGTEQARREARRFVCALMNGIHKSAEHEPLYPQTPANLLWVWNGVNVLNEMGITYVDEDYDIFTKSSYLEGYYPNLEREALGYPLSDEYWRGIAAMTLTGLRPDPEEDVLGYVMWAGAQADVAKAINTAKDRNTLNVETLTGIIAQQDTTKPPLNSGIL